MFMRGRKSKAKKIVKKVLYMSYSPDPTTNSETTNPEFKTIFLIDQISSEKKTNKFTRQYLPADAKVLT